MPQSQDEKWAYYRTFYRSNGFVHGAINFHTDMPLSKTRLRPPKAADKDLARQAMRFCERWTEEVDLQHTLMEILHDFNLIGQVTVYAVDKTPDMPQEIRQQATIVRSPDGSTYTTWTDKPDADACEVRWLKKHYKGWSDLIVIPPEMVRTEGFILSRDVIVSLIPDSSTKAIVQRGLEGDLSAIQVVDSLPQELVDAVVEGNPIPLNTDPYAGSFVRFMARKHSQYETLGISLLEPIMHALVYRDKLRQAQTSIASRHMTPYRIVTAPLLNSEQLDDLRNQVEEALQDPDFSVVANYEINWDERGAENRLLNIEGEYEITNKEMYAGLGMTEGLLTGESVYSGDRITVELINRRFMLVREILTKYVDKYLLKPMCARMGFVETDEDGYENVIYPRLSFTRLSIRDNTDMFDMLFNLYQKGSLDVETIYDHLNLDGDAVRENLRKDLFTIEDSSFNELIRGIYSGASEQLITRTEILEVLARNMGFTLKEAPEEDAGRY